MDEDSDAWGRANFGRGRRCLENKKRGWEWRANLDCGDFERRMENDGHGLRKKSLSPLGAATTEPRRKVKNIEEVMQRSSENVVESRWDGIPAADIDRLVALQHSDPHSILGAHAGPDGVTVRAFRPGARDVSVIADDGTRPWRMAQIHADGLFEATIRDRHAVFPYEIRIQYGDGTVVTTPDPYSFLPTLGPLDQYLWNECKHQRAYEKLGAHPHAANGISGTAFAWWSPTARALSALRASPPS